ncbi:hypothetical protein [Caballeronia sp. M23-90]
MTEWTENKKWCMDLLKNAISFVAAAAITLFVINRVQDSHAFENAKATAYYSERVKALDEFESAALRYDLSAHTAFTDLFEWRSKQKTSAMLKYEQDDYPRWLLALETVQFLFVDCANAVQALEDAGTRRHKIYHDNVVAQVDRNGEIDEKWRSEQVNNLWKARKEFDNLTDDMGQKRKHLVAGIQTSLFPIKDDKSIATACASQKTPQ